MSKQQAQISSIDEPSAALGSSSAAPKALALQARSGGGDAALSGREVIVTIPASDNAIDGTDAVPVGINGYVWQIPRGKPCRVPEEVAMVLNDAVITKYQSHQGGGETGVDFPRHSFNAQPVPEAVAA